MLDALRAIALRVVVVDAIVAAGVGLLGLILRWSTREQWGEAFVWSGLVAVAIGGLAVRGAWDSRLSHVGLAATAGQPSMAERTAHTVSETSTAYRRLVFLLLVGLPLVALGIALDPRFP